MASVMRLFACGSKSKSGRSKASGSKGKSGRSKASAPLLPSDIEAPLDEAPMTAALGRLESLSAKVQQQPQNLGSVDAVNLQSQQQTHQSCQSSKRKPSAGEELELDEELDAETRRRIFNDVENHHTIGVCHLLLNAAFLLRWPQYFWVWHVMKAFIFLPWCFWRKQQKGYEWFLIEFCYVNVYYTVACGMVAIFRFTYGLETPLHALNFAGCRTIFAFANGALLLSVPMFGNKVVFHDIDNTIALYVHLSPALMTWSLRWGGGFGTSLIERTWPTLFNICEDMDDDSFLNSLSQGFWSWDECHANLQELVFYPALAWLLLWGLPYFLVRFYFFKGYIEQMRKQTMYSEVFGKQAKSLQAKCLLTMPESIRPLIYMLQHFIWTTFACLLSLVLWHSFALHTLLLLAFLVLALHNGSSYFFEVVSMKRVPSLIRKQKKKDLRLNCEKSMSDNHAMSPFQRHLMNDIRGPAPKETRDVSFRYL